MIIHMDPCSIWHCLMNNVSLVAARHYDTEHRLVISQAVLANTKESFYNAVYQTPCCNVVSMPKLSSHWRSDRNGCHKVVSVLTGLGCSVLSPPCQREIDWSQAQTEWGDTQKIWSKHWETFESSEYYVQTAMKSWWQAFVLGVYLSFLAGKYLTIIGVEL